jgi:recombinational DNA repair protein RecT
LGLEPKLSHIPNFDSDRNVDKIRWIYAVAKTIHDEYIFKVMTRKEIMDIAKMGEMRNSLYFNDKKDPQNWMAKKVVIKQLSKLLPKDYYGQKAVSMDDVVEGGGYITTNDLNEVELVEEKSERPKKAGIYSTLLHQENLNS